MERKNLSQLLLVSALLTSSACYAEKYSFVLGFKDSNASKNIAARSLALPSAAKIEEYKALNSYHALITINDQKKIRSLTADAKLHEALSLGYELRAKNPRLKYALSTLFKFSAIKQKVSYAEFEPNAETSLGMPIMWQNQWDLHASQRSSSINADKAWALLKTVPTYPVYVAVVDTGIGNRAPADIMNRISTGIHFSGEEELGWDNNFYDSTKDSHGTHVAGTIAANGKVVFGATAALPYVSVQPVKVLEDNGSGSFMATFAGIDWAVGVIPGSGFLPEDVPANNLPAQVINVSLGASRYDERTDQESMSKEDWEQLVVSQFCPAWEDVIHNAHQIGASIFIAAGNDSHDVSDNIPSGCVNLAATVVEATNRNGILSRYSTTATPESAGSNTIVRAPGGEYDPIYRERGEILSTLNGSYGYMQGTSMATPHVTGIAALLYAVNPHLTQEEVNAALSSAHADTVVDAELAVKNVLNRN